jgi:hypothetical protein
VRASGGRACPPVLAWEGGSRRGHRSRRGHLGVPQEPGRPVCPRRYFRLCGSADSMYPGPAVASEPQKGANSSLAHGGRPLANPMSLGRWGGRSRRASYYRRSRRTGRPARSRWREGGFLVNRPSSGNRAGTSRPDPLSTQGRRIAVLAVVSGGSPRATGACEWLAGRAGCGNSARPDPVQRG